MKNNYETRLEKAGEAIANAECTLIGAGAGLSDAAGLKFSGKRWSDNFAPFIEKYGMEDMYTSSFYPFETEEERWAYWALHIHINRFSMPSTQLYIDVLQLVKEKEYFVITTNVESQFYKAGFPRRKVFAVQGDYGYLQCAKGCHDMLYYNEPEVKAMLAHTKDCKIPSFLIPKCPICGGKMDVNLRKDNYFVEDENWHWMAGNYEAFLQENRKKRIVFLELGVGFNTAGIIRIPFEQMTYQNKQATLVRMNRDYPEGVKENVEKTIAFSEDMGSVISSLNATLQTVR